MSNKRTNQITINLTDEEMELIEVLAQKYERKTAELCRILAYKKALELWSSDQAQKHKDAPFEPLKF